MNTETIETGRFKDDYCRDGLVFLIVSFLILTVSVGMLAGFSLSFLLLKPKPVHFKTGDDWRVLPPVPVTQPYIPEPSLVQWVSDTLPKVFTVDFVNYTSEVTASSPYFTADGWKKFQQALLQYAAPNRVVKEKLFVRATAGGAPFILNQGLIQGSYGWWIQMPLNLSYSSSDPGSTRPVVFQILVVRVPTLDDLMGIKIDNVVVKEGEQSASND